MSPIQQMLLGVGAVATKTYVDDIFSTFLYNGTGSAQTFNTGTDLSSGGMVWTKRRDSSQDHVVTDSAWGLTKQQYPNMGQTGGISSSRITAFNNNGFSIGTSSQVNTSSATYTSWSFAKKSGFFDCIKYTGTGSARTVAHDLGCIPGMIIIKRRGSFDDWQVYHRSQHSSPAGYYLALNTTDSVNGASNRWNNTLPTATEFTLGTAPIVNADGDEYLAYVFAGGESTQNEAVSVDFDGSGDYLSVAASSDLAPGTGDFTLECWVKPDNWSNTYVELYGIQASTGLRLIKNSGNIAVAFYGSSPVLSTSQFPEIGQWTHVAVTRSGTNLSLFYNGIKIKTVTNSTNATGQGPLLIGDESGGGSEFDGKISNVRFVKGTAVYTSSFRPPTEPLTNITNTKLLCCNNSSTTGSTVTPGTITANGNPTASTDSPFDDPAGFVFGDAGDQNVIKCGSYVGNGSDTGPEINLGFEPQWVMVKNADYEASGTGWAIFDVMRGITSEGNDLRLYANTDGSDTSNTFLDITSTGFKITKSSSFINRSGSKIIYMAIRRPDGYVGKPPSLGTDVFAMDTGAGSSTIPNYDSGFPVDFAIEKYVTGSQAWYGSARLIGDKYLEPNDTTAEANGGGAYVWDSNLGWYASTGVGSSYQSWMWKRSNSFTTLAYKGNGVAGRQIAHDMNNTVEMIWTKRRSPAAGWRVWHKGLNGGGSNAATYYLSLNETTAQTSNGDIYGSSSGILPTSTHWTVGSNAAVNENGSDFISMLFSSVSGISAVGSYTGTGSSGNSVSLGFQPRFLIVKNADWSHGDWFVYDTTRGWASGDDKTLKLNSGSAQLDNSTWDIDPTSTGFTVQSNDGAVNNNGHNFIYYAHA